MNICSELHMSDCSWSICLLVSSSRFHNLFIPHIIVLADQTEGKEMVEEMDTQAISFLNCWKCLAYLDIFIFKAPPGQNRDKNIQCALLSCGPTPHRRGWCLGHWGGCTFEVSNCWDRESKKGKAPWSIIWKMKCASISSFSERWPGGSRNQKPLVGRELQGAVMATDVNLGAGIWLAWTWGLWGQNWFWPSEHNDAYSHLGLEFIHWKSFRRIMKFPVLLCLVSSLSTEGTKGAYFAHLSLERERQTLNEFSALQDKMVLEQNNMLILKRHIIK